MSGVEVLKLCNFKDVEMECEYSDSKENEIPLDVYLREAKLERERNLMENRRLLMGDWINYC